MKKCPDCLKDVDTDDKGNLLDPNRDKVKHPRALHFCKPRATSIRERLALAAPMKANEIVELLARCVEELQDTGVATPVDDQMDLIKVLAEDMKRKDGWRKERSDDYWQKSAKDAIEGNHTTALTTSDDHYTYIKKGEKFDEIHELIHICSGQGGESPQVKFCKKFNEGAINYFSELVSRKLGVPVAKRYPSETAIASKLVQLVKEPEGSKRLFGSTFQGKIDEFFLAVGVAYRNLGDRLPNEK